MIVSNHIEIEARPAQGTSDFVMKIRDKNKDVDINVVLGEMDATALHAILGRYLEDKQFIT